MYCSQIRLQWSRYFVSKKSKPQHVYSEKHGTCSGQFLYTSFIPPGARWTHSNEWCPHGPPQYDCNMSARRIDGQTFNTSFFSFLQLGRGVRGDCRTGLSGDTAHPSLHSSHHPACPPEEPSVAWDTCDSSEKEPPQTGAGAIGIESGDHKGGPKTGSPTLNRDLAL